MLKLCTKKGFLLISCVLYLSLSTLLLLLSVRWYIRWKEVVIEHLNSHRAHMQKTLAITLLRRDIRQAPTKHEAWKKISADTIIWNNQEDDIGWSIDKEQLIRREGKYSKESEQWRDYTSSLICSDLSSLTFQSYMDNNGMKAIILSMQEKDGIDIDHYMVVADKRYQCDW